MKRREFSALAFSAALAGWLTTAVRRWKMGNTEGVVKSTRMPVLFLGHGSPMNAIETNRYTQALSALGSRLPKPKAILAVSAHWMTKGTWVTHMARPRTIHDFGGFPEALFQVQYPALGAPEIAESIQAQIDAPKIQSDDDKWGLDHGTWSVLTHVYPEANIPVVQLSLDMSQPAEFHFELGRKLQNLRDQGVLIVGSGNVVHNLRRIDWDENAKPPAWAVEFDEWIKGRLEARDFKALVHEPIKTEAGRLSVPTFDHYYPLLYILGAAHPHDRIGHVSEGIQNGSISMRSVQFG